MTDVIQMTGRIIGYTIVYGAVPIVLLRVLRSLAEQRRRLKELPARVDLLEQAGGARAHGA